LPLSVEVTDEAMIVNWKAAYCRQLLWRAAFLHADTLPSSLQKPLSVGCIANWVRGASSIVARVCQGIDARYFVFSYFDESWLMYFDLKILAR